MTDLGVFDFEGDLEWWLSIRTVGQGMTKPTPNDNMLAFLNCEVEYLFIWLNINI